MPVTGRPRTYAPDRPATAAERQARWRQAQLSPDRLQHRLKALVPDDCCRTFGSCTLYCCPCELLYPLLPRASAILTDPPYDANYDVTRTRRRPSHWDHNFVGHDQPFDPRPWLKFAEVILMGADHYRQGLPPRDGWILWDKIVNTTPADFAVGEWIWTSLDIDPQVYCHLWRGGMRQGEANMARMRHKPHPAYKAPELMQLLVRLLSPARTIVDPYMGSGPSMVACLREGRSGIGIEVDCGYFAKACAKMEKELQQLPLFA
jgi:hypothetical protein